MLNHYTETHSSAESVLGSSLDNWEPAGHSLTVMKTSSGLPSGERTRDAGPCSLCTQESGITCWSPICCLGHSRDLATELRLSPPVWIVSPSVLRKMEAASAQSGSAVYLMVCSFETSSAGEAFRFLTRTGPSAEDGGSVAIFMLILHSGNRVKSLEISFLNVDCTYQSQILTPNTKQGQHAMTSRLGFGFILTLTKHKRSCLFLAWVLRIMRERKKEPVF